MQNISWNLALNFCKTTKYPFMQQSTLHSLTPLNRETGLVSACSYSISKLTFSSANTCTVSAHDGVCPEELKCTHGNWLHIRYPRYTYMSLCFFLHFPFLVSEIVAKYLKLEIGKINWYFTFVNTIFVISQSSMASVTLGTLIPGPGCWKAG